MLSSTDISNLTLPEKVIEQVKVAAVLSRKAAAMEQAHSTEAAKAQALIPGTVDALVMNKRASEDQKDALSKALATHAGTLELLAKCAKHRVADEVAPASLGTVKQASAVPKSRSALDEAERALFAAFGVAT